MAAKHRICVTLFLLLLLGNSRLCAQDEVKFEILPGFSGSFNAGYWIPLTLLVETEVPPFDGILEASLPLGGIHRADRGSYTISRRVSLEPGTSRRIIFSIPLQRREELTVRLLRDNQVIAGAEFTLNPYGYSGKTLLLLSRRPDIGIQTGPSWLSLSAHPETLPVTPAGYSSVSAVILHDAPLNEISPLQIEALADWVRGGGLLIVTGGITRPDLLPAELTDLFPYFLHGRGSSSEPPALAGSESRPLPDVPGYPLWLGELKNDARPLFEADSGESGTFPMEAVRSEGRGRVAACLIDPASAPYRKWEGLGDYWAILLSAQPEARMEYPLSDPLPDLHSQLGSRMSDSARLIPAEGGWFLAPLLLLFVPAFLKRRLRGWLILSVLLPLAVSISIATLLPAEKPVYREISLIKGSFAGSSGDLWLKGGITSRSGGDISLSLGNKSFLVLPNGNESLRLSENPREVVLSRERWESREFFLGSPAAIPVETEVSRNTAEVSGYLRWQPGGNYRNAILLGGELAAEQVLLLSEPGGLSFRASLSRDSSSLEKEAEYIKESVKGFTPAQRGYLDYLISGGHLPREKGADFYFLLFNDSGGTILNPKETENIGLSAVLLEFDLEEIPYED